MCRFARKPMQTAERTSCSLSCHSDEENNNHLALNICKVPITRAIPSHKAKLISYDQAAGDGIPRITSADNTEQAHERESTRPMSPQQLC